MKAVAIRKNWHLLFLPILWLPLEIKSQSDYRCGVSGFFVSERQGLPIGFTSLEMQKREFQSEKLAVDLGMRFIGATVGRRGGYFAFGYFSELVFNPTRPFQPGLSAGLLGGGGAAAPDYDGWMLQGTAFIQHILRNGAALRVGVNYACVSRGVIAGFSPVIGFNWKLRTGLDSIADGRPSGWSSVYAECGVAAFKGRRLNFIGSGLHLKLGEIFSGDLSIHALTNIYGGYMQLLFSAGPQFNAGRFSISPGLAWGLGGGGSVETMGGALYGIHASVRYNGTHLYAGLKYQFVKAFYDQFEYNGLFLSVGKPLGAQKGFSWDLATKAYIGAEGFGNLGARFTAYENKNLRLMGSTFWAFTHNRGAYAEGLFEASVTVFPRFPLYLIGSFGAGAGSGINQGKTALICAAGVGYAIPSRVFPMNVELARWQGGNIPSWSVGLAWRVRN